MQIVSRLGAIAASTATTPRPSIRNAHIHTRNRKGAGYTPQHKTSSKHSIKKHHSIECHTLKEQQLVQHFQCCCSQMAQGPTGPAALRGKQATPRGLLRCPQRLQTGSAGCKSLAVQEQQLLCKQALTIQVVKPTPPIMRQHPFLLHSQQPN